MKLKYNNYLCMIIGHYRVPYNTTFNNISIICLDIIWIRVNWCRLFKSI